MKNTILFLIISMAISCQPESQSKIPDHVIISQPVTIEDDNWKFEGTENMIFVPENRNDKNSRQIALHFFRFPAKKKSNLPPVVFLGAGPGEPYSVEVFYDGKRAEAWRYELNFVNQNRDVILINQRGNSDAPGLQISEFKFRWNNGGSLDQPFDFKTRYKNRRESYLEHIQKYKDQGVDLRGYDIIHFVDDIEAVRKILKYNKLALIGNSFASQWALGYIQRYPENVDRALLSSIEPLDHNYDDPDELWKVFQKIETYAKADPTIAKDLPKIGLLEAFKIVIRKLEKQPETVSLKLKDGREEEVVVGADDLRFNLIYNRVRSYKAEIEAWPKYITEMYRGDFRALAYLSMGRVYNSSSLMVNPLFNNSLGISKERESKINNSKSMQFLGNINEEYISLRDICPAPKVPDDFRQHKKHDIPMIIIQGDMDMSTPYDNAKFLMNHLEKGHLITVKRGFHSAKRALIFADETLIYNIYSFMNQDFEKEDFHQFKTTLPQEFELPEFNFWPIKGKSLYEKMLSRRKK